MSKNALASAQRLPDEFLSRIFILSEPTFGDFGLPSVLYSWEHFWWINRSILHVCRHWRYIGLNTPELWTTLIWRPGRKEYIHRALKLSRDQPIRVYALAGEGDSGNCEYDILSDLEDDDEDGIGGSPRYLGNPPPECWHGHGHGSKAPTRKYYDPGDFLKDLVPHAHRLRHFHFTIPGVSQSEIEKYFGDLEAPMLDSMTLSTSFQRWGNKKSAGLFFERDYCTLDKLWLSYFATWPSEYIPFLSHLALETIDLDNPITFDAFLNVLNTGINLQVLVLHAASRSNSYDVDHNPVYLRDLKMLVIKADASQTARILEYIALPPQASLIVDGGASFTQPDKVFPFFPDFTSHLHNLDYPDELVIFWECGDYGSLMLRQFYNTNPTFATAARRIEDIPAMLKEFSAFTDLRYVRRLSLYSSYTNAEDRTHAYEVWESFLKSMPNLEAIHLCGYEPTTLLEVLEDAGNYSQSGANADDEPPEHPKLDMLFEEMESHREEVEAAEEAYDKLKEEYKDVVRESAKTYEHLVLKRPTKIHNHMVKETSTLDTKLHGHPAEAVVRHGCRWQDGVAGSHCVFVEASIVRTTSIRDKRITRTPGEDFDTLRDWAQQWATYWQSFLVQPSLLASPLDGDL
ncbi:hypothetical protein K474DRAFT_138761 [Panus rudis PR-1116 ss-1]|nr:hypothetical protein K474DRAFT_138761 [Panus rudis PR-1116 ss-1]